ncbi:unnamed protein product [Auanema sp. JU1783]|nr:unnamed protein product [Auanema sp. JU1783]
MLHLFVRITLLLYAVLALDSSAEDGLWIPADAIGRPKEPVRNLLNNSIPESERNKCYCTYSEDICGHNKTCIKDDLAACFHAVEEIYDRKQRSLVTLHKYGCAPLEKGSDGSHLTCNSWRSAHRKPQSIGCCYEGNYCNLHVVPPPYVNPLEVPSSFLLELIEDYIILFISLCLIKLVLIVLLCVYLRKRYIARITEKKALLEKDSEKDPILIDDSGSGSGQTTLNQRTVAQNLVIIEVIGRGRYGEVRKAMYRGNYVAVKTFYTTDEESWRNEKAVYQTQMLNHENILQYVAADICSENSITQMLLITDYHEHGSLSDYLRREETLTVEEALRLAHSTICGIDHLHNGLHGTGNLRKPEIAHRDIKSKNIIVKRKGVCCIADFGLAVRYDGRLIPEKVNVQVGTKRYMAPEVLSKTLMPSSFDQFKMADIYSFALVLWEISRRTEWQTSEETQALVAQRVAGNQTAAQSDSSGIGESLEDASSPRIQHMQKPSLDMTSKALPYVPPFEGMVQSDPSFEEMRVVVAEKGLRPPLDENWTRDKNVAMYMLKMLMQECWHMNPHRRHTALKIKFELSKAIEEVQDGVKLIQKQSMSSVLAPRGKRDTADSGFKENVL